MVLKTHEVVADRARFSRKVFLPKNWENKPEMGLKQGFLNLLKNMVINIY